MSASPRVPAVEVSGPRGWLIKRFARRAVGRVPSSIGVYWHHRRVLPDLAGFGRRVRRWDVCDPQLTSFAHMAVASRVGCTWCLDFAYVEAHRRNLELAKASEIPGWRESDVFSPLERDVLEYAEAMTETPPTVTDEMVASLRARLGDAALVELTAVVGFANATTRPNVALGIESDGFASACGLEAPASRGAVGS